MVFLTSVGVEEAKKRFEQNGINGVKVQPASAGKGSLLIVDDQEFPAQVRGQIEGCFDDVVWAQ